MFKNREIVKLISLQIILFLVVLITIISLNKINNNYYQKEIIKNNSNIIGDIITNHPELEEDVIKSLLLQGNNYQKGYDVLKKYGLNDVDNVEYLDNISTIEHKIFINNFIIAILIFITFSLINLFFIHKIYRKIRHIDNYMVDILNNKPSLSIKDNNEGDISNLKNDTYKMTVKLKEFAEKSLQDKLYLEQILSDISHQIKTPLTSMYVINDLLNEELELKVKKDFLNKNKTQLNRIEWLVTSLLKMSRLDSGSAVLKKENVKIIDLINKVIIPLQIPIELKNIKLDININNDLELKCDINWTVEAIINIVKNAYEHTPNDGTIDISASTNPIYTEISIKDSGEGISKKDAPHIFERFYKGETNKESIGIGLNMAKTIIEKQNGNISFETSDKGTKFIIKFYKV